MGGKARNVPETQLTRRPVPETHQGNLEALVYLKQSCQTFPLPSSGSVRLGRGPAIFASTIRPYRAFTS